MILPQQFLSKILQSLNTKDLLSEKNGVSKINNKKTLLELNGNEV